MTSHGKLVGRLLGPLPESLDTESLALQRLQAQPWVRPGNGKKVRGSNRPVKVPKGTTAELLRWVRGA